MPEQHGLGLEAAQATWNRIAVKEEQRATRIRGRALQRIRLAHFRKHPLCVGYKAPADHVALAVELDHTIPLHKGGTDTADNRQGLCRECHLRKSIEERGLSYRPKRAIGLDGYPSLDR